MIPICLITGFLGGGKTTLVKRVASANRSRRLVYLINEFSALDIDGSMVSSENPDVVSIPGGSIFCKCLVTEFISQLKRIEAEWDGIEGVVIEASGMANPKVVEDMLSETGLDELYRLASVVSVLDPNSFLKLRHTLPNILAQIESADLVLINKTDCSPPEMIAEAHAEVEKINSRADIGQVVMCDIDFELFPPDLERNLHGEYAKCRDPNYTQFITDYPYSCEHIEGVILANTDLVYRVKGMLAGEYFDYSASGIRRTASGANPTENGLAWIVKGGSEKRIQDALSIYE